MSDKVQRFGKHENAFGFLRLLLASLVIVSHTPELADGDRSREILTRLFGSLSFGELAVDGFFIVSGFLIAGSWLKKPSFAGFLRKRVARIYPAFIVCSIICIVVVAPLGGAPVGVPGIGDLRSIATLAAPQVPGAFSGSHDPWLNGSMWTIGYEFRCYLLIALLGLLGVLRRPVFLAALAACLYAAYVLAPPVWITWSNAVPHSGLVFGDLRQSLRLTSVFVVGALFFVARKRIAYTPELAGISALLLIAGMIYPLAANAAVAVFGGYLILFFAHRAKGPFTTINNHNDVSYGVYLYAWPVEKLIFWHWPQVPLAVAGIVTIALSYILGWASWRLIERPSLSRFGKRGEGQSALLPTTKISSHLHACCVAVAQRWGSSAGHRVGRSINTIGGDDGRLQDVVLVEGNRRSRLHDLDDIANGVSRNSRDG